MESRETFELANQRTKEKLEFTPTALSAQYDRNSGRIVIHLSSGLDISFPPGMVQGLENASAAELKSVEITPSGFGIHFRELDADLYLPALLEGSFGSKEWMAARLGEIGGRSRSQAKRAASKRNGALGGRPPKKKRRVNR